MEVASIFVKDWLLNQLVLSWILFISYLPPVQIAGSFFLALARENRLYNCRVCGKSLAKLDEP